jgi:hypothetical protein
VKLSLARRGRPVVDAPDRPRPHPTPQPGEPPQVSRLNVAAVPDLAVLGPGLEFTSQGRFHCDVDVREADVVLVTPCSPGTLHGLRQRLRPSADLVVVDRRGACAPELVADMLDGGATTVVTGGNSAVLVAYLDAMARRKR